jgi:hypothetical protein
VRQSKRVGGVKVSEETTTSQHFKKKDRNKRTREKKGKDAE